MNTATIAAPSNVTPFAQNLKAQQPKQQTAKEAIAANVQALIEQLEQGHSEGLTAYLTAMGRFHNYSLGNILEIARQRPTATRVAGLYAWNQLGRKVKKGERGIRILAPVVGIRRKKDSEAEKDIRTQNQAVLVGFRSAYVFDVCQTEGKDLPALSERVTGDVGEYRERLLDFIAAQGIRLEFKESIAPALGMSYGGRIAILPGQGSAEEFSTLVHELAHLCFVENYVVVGSRAAVSAWGLRTCTQHKQVAILGGLLIAQGDPHARPVLFSTSHHCPISRFALRSRASVLPIAFSAGRAFQENVGEPSAHLELSRTPFTT
jgi:N-terminal domain of anti-restriction factor ArdC